MLLRISSDDEIVADSDVLLPISNESSSLSDLRFYDIISVFCVLILIELLLFRLPAAEPLLEPLLAFEILLF